MLRRTLLVIAATIAGYSSAQAQDTGVPACDAFYKAYEACAFSRIPEAQRGALKQQIDAARATIKQAADNVSARPQLEQACNAQKQQISKALESLGCKWD